MSEQERRETVKEALKMASEASLRGDEEQARKLVEWAREFGGGETPAPDLAGLEAAAARARAVTAAWMHRRADGTWELRDPNEELRTSEAA